MRLFGWFPVNRTVIVQLRTRTPVRAAVPQPAQDAYLEAVWRQRVARNESERASARFRAVAAGEALPFLKRQAL